MSTAELMNVIDELNDADYNSVVSYVFFLRANSKNSRASEGVSALREIQEIMASENTYESEEEIFEEMRKFRRKRSAS